MYKSENQGNHFSFCGSCYNKKTISDNFSQKFQIPISGYQTAIAVLIYGPGLTFLETISHRFSSRKWFTFKILSNTNPKIICQIDCHWKLCVVLFQHIKHKQVSPNWGIWRGMYLKIWKHLHWKIAQTGTTTKYFKAVYIAVLTTWNYFRPEKKGLVLSAVYRKYCKSLKNGVK